MTAGGAPAGTRGAARTMETEYELGGMRFYRDSPSYWGTQMFARTPSGAAGARAAGSKLRRAGSGAGSGSGSLSAASYELDEPRTEYMDDSDEETVTLSSPRRARRRKAAELERRYRERRERKLSEVESYMGRVRAQQQQAPRSRASELRRRVRRFVLRKSNRMWVKVSEYAEYRRERSKF